MGSARVSVVVLGALGVFQTVGVGCAGPDCQSTCNRLYQTEECNLQSPGNTQTDLLSICMESCENGLDTPGDIGLYDPHAYTPASEEVTLNNDKQTAVWMDCVTDVACELLGSGYCAPVW